MKKEEQIRMLLHPERYTDEQLDQMLDEVNVPVPDANEAWRAFRNGGKQTEENRGSFYPVRKIAAMFVSVLMLSGIAYAAYHGLQHNREIIRALSADGDPKPAPAG